MGKLNVDTALIETLAELLQRTGLTEIELGRRRRHPRGACAAAADRAALARARAGARGARPRPDRPSPAGATSPTRHPGAVRAPMVGTVYLTPEPGAPPFVRRRRRGPRGPDAADHRGDEGHEPDPGAARRPDRELLVSNGDPVEYGELLLIIE